MKIPLRAGIALAVALLASASPARAGGKGAAPSPQEVRAVIDKAASYLMSDVGFVVDPEDGAAAEEERARRAERALKLVYEANNLDQLDFDGEIDTSVLGDGAYKVTWDPVERRVRVTAPDVQGIFAWWHGDDPSRVWRLASRYTLSAAEAARLYGAGDGAERSRDSTERSRGFPASAASRSAPSTMTEIWTADAFELRRLSSRPACKLSERLPPP